MVRTILAITRRTNREGRLSENRWEKPDLFRLDNRPLWTDYVWTTSTEPISLQSARPSGMSEIGSRTAHRLGLEHSTDRHSDTAFHSFLTYVGITTMAIGEQGQFESNEKVNGQGNAGGDEALFVRVQSETGKGDGKGDFSGGSSMTKALLGNVEITGAEQGRAPEVIQLAQNQPRTRPDAQEQQGRTRPDAGQQAQGEREVLNPSDGSKLRISSNFPDGQQRITRVTEPDGLAHTYTYGNVNGQIVCTGAEDTNSRPPVKSTLTGPNMWTIEAGGQRFNVAGALTVDGQGVHRFTEANGNVFTRKPNGEAWYENSRGNRLYHPMEHGTKQRPVKQPGQQSDPLQPPPVRRKM